MADQRSRGGKKKGSEGPGQSGQAEQHQGVRAMPQPGSAGRKPDAGENRGQHDNPSRAPESGGRR